MEGHCKLCQGFSKKLRECPQCERLMCPTCSTIDRDGQEICQTCSDYRALDASEEAEN
jgi:hypothetical protein